MNSPLQMRRMATCAAVGFRAVGSALRKPSRQRKCFPAALRTGKHAQPSKQTQAGTSVHEKNNGRAWSRARHPPTAPPQNADCISVSSPCLNFRRERVPRRFPARSQHEKKESHTPRTQKKEENSQKASVPPLTACISYFPIGSHAPTNIESLSPLHTIAATSQDDKKDCTSLKSTLLSHIIQQASVPSCTGSSAQKSGGSNMQSSMEPFSRLQEPSATSQGDRKDLLKHSNTQSSSVFFRHVFLLVF